MLEGEEAGEEVDKVVLDLSMSLVQHRLTDRAFDSAIVSFAAMLAWDSTRQTWKGVNNYASYLSQLIYDGQIFILLHCLEITDSEGGRGLSSYIVRIRDDWLLNDTPGPVAELSGTRLLGFEISRNTVNQAQVRWHSDEQTIVYKDIQLTTAQLQDLVAKELQAATDILERDLCFGLKTCHATNRASWSTTGTPPLRVSPFSPALETHHIYRTDRPGSSTNCECIRS